MKINYTPKPFPWLDFFLRGELKIKGTKNTLEAIVMYLKDLDIRPVDNRFYTWTGGADGYIYLYTPGKNNQLPTLYINLVNLTKTSGWPEEWKEKAKVINASEILKLIKNT